MTWYLVTLAVGIGVGCYAGYRWGASVVRKAMAVEGAVVAGVKKA